MAGNCEIGGGNHRCCNVTVNHSAPVAAIAHSADTHTRAVTWRVGSVDVVHSPAARHPLAAQTLNVWNFWGADSRELRAHLLHCAATAEAGLFTGQSRCVRSRLAIQQSTALDLGNDLHDPFFRCVLFGSDPREARPLLTRFESSIS